MFPVKILSAAAFIVLLVLPFKQIPPQTQPFVSFNLQVSAGGAVYLQWSTSNDVTIVRFEIERSTDNTSWQKLGEMIAGPMQHYSFTDNRPNDGSNSYRIKKITTGNYAYSPIESVHISKAASSYIWPDPAKDILHVRCGYQSGYIEIIDVSGKVLHKWAITAFTTNIPIWQLKKGIYFLRIIDNNNKQSVQRFLKS